MKENTRAQNTLNASTDLQLKHIKNICVRFFCMHVLLYYIYIYICTSEIINDDDNINNDDDVVIVCTNGFAFNYGCIDIYLYIYIPPPCIYMKKKK